MVGEEGRRGGRACDAGSMGWSNSLLHSGVVQARGGGGRLGVVSSSFHLRRYARARGKGGGGVAKQLTGVPFSEVKLSLLLNLERQSSFLGT